MANLTTMANYRILKSEKDGFIWMEIHPGVAIKLFSEDFSMLYSVDECDGSSSLIEDIRDLNNAINSGGVFIEVGFEKNIELIP